jgi:hypothetical protein
LDKYDEAIDFLREQDAKSGSMFEECACIIEELLFRVHQLETKPGEEDRLAVEREMKRGLPPWQEQQRKIRDASEP